MKRVVATVIAAACLSVGLAAQDAKKIAAGKGLYEKGGCEKCHQIAGKGSKIAPLDGVGGKLKADEIKKWLTDPDEMTAKLPKKPVVKMKKVEMPDADLDALAAYLSSLKK